MFGGCPIMAVEKRVANDQRKKVAESTHLEGSNSSSR